MMCSVDMYLGHKEKKTNVGYFIRLIDPWCPRLALRTYKVAREARAEAMYTDPKKRRARSTEPPTEGDNVRVHQTVRVSP